MWVITVLVEVIILGSALAWIIYGIWRATSGRKKSS